jgi:antitoxin MazE
MRVLVKKRGNSASVRIPTAVMEAARLSLDQPVDIREEAGRVIIEPIREPAFNLADLLAAVTDQDIRAEIGFGAPVGKELLWVVRGALFTPHRSGATGRTHGPSGRRRAKPIPDPADSKKVAGRQKGLSGFLG